MENENEELEIQHRQYIMEEEINVSELPNELKQAMRNFNAKLKKYEGTQDEEEENELFHELQQDDVAIADDILTWWEDKNSEDEEEVEDEEEEEPKPKEVKKPTAQSTQAKEPVAAPIPEPIPEPIQPVFTTEQKVRDLIKDNIISLEDLTNAIGEEPEYPEHIIGKLRLRKQYLKRFYEVVS